MPRRWYSKPAVLVAIVALWIPAVAYGIRMLLSYTFTPGRPAAPMATMPQGTPVRAVPGHASLVIFLHPQCPCSRASLGELALIMPHGRERLDVTAFFYLPASEAESWAQTDLWRSAVAIPGVRALTDRRGAMARTFGAFTSGQALLYDPRGHLVFSGGLTAYRGHSGDNAGRDAVVSWLEGRAPRTRSTPVFGCSLIGGD